MSMLPIRLEFTRAWQPCSPLSTSESTEKFINKGREVRLELAWLRKGENSKIPWEIKKEEKAWQGNVKMKIYVYWAEKLGMQRNSGD